MSYKELIDALRQEGEGKIAAVWRDAEAEAERIRDDTAERINELREQYALMRESAIKEETGAIISGAEKKAMAVRLASEKALSERLYKLALSTLSALRDEKYGDIFVALVRELPPYKWQTVRVNPEDEGSAKKYFPESEIISDESIAGGLEATAGDGRIKIANTFEKRLDRGWPEILHGLMSDIHEYSSKTAR